MAQASAGTTTILSVDVVSVPPTGLVVIKSAGPNLGPITVFLETLVRPRSVLRSIKGTCVEVVDYIEALICGSDTSFMSTQNMCPWRDVGAFERLAWCIIWKWQWLRLEHPVAKKAHRRLHTFQRDFVRVDRWVTMPLKQAVSNTRRIITLPGGLIL